MKRIIQAKVLKWGNSYALRLTKRDVERAGWHEGTTLTVSAVDEDDRLDVPHFTFAGGSNGSIEHDEVLYGWHWRA